MAIVLDGTTNTVTPLNGALGATTPSTVVATTVVASSTIKGATTIAVGNATPSASGAGITFPATQSASTDANTLDDYEEGTWTPTQGSGLTVVGAFSSAGSYTKIGNVVTIRGYVKGATSVAITANAQLCLGLPFNSGSSLPYANGFATNGATTAGGFLQPFTTGVYTATAFSASSDISFTCIYTV